MLKTIEAVQFAGGVRCTGAHMELPTSKKRKIHLTQEKATLLITLHAKALDNRSNHSLLHDKMADEIMSAIDYDFTKFKGLGNDNVTVVRAKQYDDWLKEFLRENSGAVVLYLGCGLDTRVTRINPPETVSWFDVDYPEVIQLRKNFYADTHSYKMVASSITDSDWLAQIPSDRPVMIVAEGVFEYLTQDEVKSLLNCVTDYFSHGWIAFDVMSSYAVNMGRSSLAETTGARHKWAVDDVSEIDKMDHKLTRIANVPALKSPFIKELPVGFRLMYGCASLIPRFRNILRLLKYQF